MAALPLENEVATTLRHPSVHRGKRRAFRSVPKLVIPAGQESIIVRDGERQVRLTNLLRPSGTKRWPWLRRVGPAAARAG